MGSSGVDFARQLREANAPPQKKFRSTAAPKGSKLASGYVDRTQMRASVDEDEKASRIKSLEEMVKLGQMEYSTFEKLRDEIVGGDVENVHLVKGLDRRLLERARKGEDVFKKPEVKVVEDSEEKEVEEEEQVDVEAALDKLEEKDVTPVERPKEKKQDSQPIAGKKRTRDDILRELKAARTQAQSGAAPALGSKFRKLGAQLQPGTSRIERDEKGREVLVTVDEEGNVKRKVRKGKLATAAPARGEKNGLLMPDKDAIPLDIDAPVIPQQPAPAEEPSEDDDDVFEGVGADYDPLGGAEDSGSDSSDLESGEESEKRKKPDSDCKSDSSPPAATKDAATDMPPPPLHSKPRNYFNDRPSSPETEAPSNPLKDPSFLAALQKASSLAGKSGDADEEDEDVDEDVEEKARRLARRKAMLETHDRDAEDMDFGFGSSRFEDQEEGEDRQIKLSKWQGDNESGEKGKGGKGQRKRGKKKKKGDKDSASDVLAVLDRRGK